MLITTLSTVRMQHLFPYKENALDLEIDATNQELVSLMITYFVQRAYDN